MKQTKTLLLFCVMLCVLGCVGVLAQDEPMQREVKPPADVRTNALRQLGLSPQQFQQIRRLNQARKPLMDDAQIRLRRAMRSLDEAIYSDQMNETEVQSRLKEFHTAQAEVGRIRFMHEFAVRRILTSDQLMKFRGIRQRFEQNVQGRVPNVVKNGALPGGAQPVRQFVKRNRRN